MATEILTIEQFATRVRRSPETVRRWFRRRMLGSAAWKPGGGTSAINIDGDRAIRALRRAGVKGV